MFGRKLAGLSKPDSPIMKKRSNQLADKLCMPVKMLGIVVGESRASRTLQGRRQLCFILERERACAALK